MGKNSNETAVKLLRSIERAINDLDCYLNILPDYADYLEKKQHEDLIEKLNCISTTIHVLSDYLIIPTAHRKHFNISDRERNFQLLVTQNKNDKIENDI